MAIQPDTYRSIRAHGTEELKVKGSRFLAEAAPVSSEEDAEEQIAAVRKREYTATHHCTAYRIGPAGEVFRYNDDGEPSSTAGPPILRQIDARDLTNTLVVVTRYYGGTKLGTGGLIRAYGDAAGLVLDRCQIVERILRTRVRLRFAYDDTSPAMHTLGLFDTRIVETRYTQETELTVAVRRSQVASLIDTFIDALGGRGRAVVVDS